MDETQPANQIARENLAQWQQTLTKNIYTNNQAFQHSISMRYPETTELAIELTHFATQISQKLLPLVAENNYRYNWPRLEAYDAIGQRIDQIVHHPNYLAAGNIIYGSKMLKYLSQPGNLLKSFCFLYLSGHAGEAGHNCPAACSAGIIRVLQKYPETPQANFYLKKLTEPSYQTNFTGAQFLTEIQGGSDVGKNAVFATQNKQQQWHISGEKWFCSNANADLILMTARYDEKIAGTKGLGLFLLPTKLENGQHNYFTLRRLKEKIGTCSMASAEIDFHQAIAYPIGKVEDGFQIVMENVLHISRFFNTFVMLGMVREAYLIALSYAKHRHAFGNLIINFPLVTEQLAIIKAENLAIQAAAVTAVHLQDAADLDKRHNKDIDLLLRILANINKYISALWGVNHIHHCIDILGGNGAIESFSALPRLLRDSIVCENWEGTHNTLRVQTLRDIHKYHIDIILLEHIQNILISLAEDTRKEQLLQFLTVVKNGCATLKKSTAILQSMMIKTVFDQLSILYLATCLLKEAQHQLESTNSLEKQLGFDLFYRLHIEKSGDQYNNTLLQKMTAIIQCETIDPKSIL